MPEEDGKIFGEAYQLYDKWRGVLISELSQWEQLTADLHAYVCKYPESQLAMRLAVGLMETFDDLYRNGAKPAMPDYIGRGDL